MSSAAATTDGGGKVIFEYLESGAALIRMGAENERVVTLTAERIASLKEAIDRARSERPNGLVFMAAHQDMFTAGADIGAIREVTDPTRGEELAREGQRVFDSIAALPFPTVAAISGPCVGGGCELALACTQRIISEQKSSVIGLPEIKLGILPGFGGTQRLPRLIGLPRALDIILAGKTLRPAQALKYGLIDEVVPFHRLKERAERIAVSNQSMRPRKLKLVDRLLTFSGFGRGIVARKARTQVAKESKGFYPAPPAALEAAVYGLQHGMQKGLELEARELGRLIVTPESKCLVNLFFLTEASKGLGKAARKEVEQLYGVVIGAGAMGAGIAGVMLRNDCSVLLKDTSEQAIARGAEQIKGYLGKMNYLSDQERSFMLNRLETTTGSSPNIGNAKFVIEAVFEELTLKRKILSEIAAELPPEAIIATNTSSLSVSAIAEGIASPGRVVGMHFFNPVEKMPLVEVVMGSKTDNRTIAIIAALATKLGKFPIVVRDVPGFLINRILTPYLNEAAYLFSEGFRIADIDRAATAFGMPMGPLRLLDEVGLDIAAHVYNSLHTAYGDRMTAPPLAEKMVAAGKKGRKSGSGFYDYGASGSEPSPGARSAAGVSASERSGDLKAISDRLIFSLINEGVRCLDEGVAGTPGKEAGDQIDLGTVMGIGFPPFRGGLMHYTQSLRAERIEEILRRLEKECGARFAPAPGITARAKSGKSFYQPL